MIYMWKANELFECLQKEASVEDIREDHTLDLPKMWSSPVPVIYCSASVLIHFKIDFQKRIDIINCYRLY